MGIFSSKKRGHTTTSNFDLNDMGVMPTMKRQVLGNGMILGLEQNAVWLYGKVPTAPVANARDSDRRMEAYQPLFNALSQIADETPRSALKRRSVTKNNYRNIHILRTNVPKTWHADVVAPRDRRTGQDTLNQWLNASLPETTVKESILALGVQLTPSTTSTGFKGALNSVHFTLMEGGTPLADYERDLEKVKRIFDRAGVTSLSGSEVASLDSWWNPGRNPDVVTLDHPDHLHVIRDKRTTRIIKDLEDQGVDCEDWPADLKDSADQEAGQAVVSFGSISDLKLNFTDPVEDYGLANWAIPLLGARALAISIRGQIEPADITGEELRRNKRNYRNDIEERVKQNKMERPEQEEKEELLGRVGSVYANDRGTPTLISASGLVAFDGKVEDWDTVVRSAAELQAMEHRQSKAWAEMMICSMRNSNPNLMDMPIQNIACSGINDVSKIGDKFGILRGFTELDKQPAYYNVEAAYGEEDAAPMSANIGSSGSGKANSINTPVVTDSGWKMLGDLEVGDSVIGRNGEPCTVLSVHDQPLESTEAYRITLDDGQTILADAQHQWVVSDYADRRRPRSAKHLAAQQNRETLTRQIDELKSVASEAGERLLSTRELSELIEEQTSIERWSTSGLYASLRMVDAAAEDSRYAETSAVDAFVSEHEVDIYDVAEFCRASIDAWRTPVVKQQEQIKAWRDAVEVVAEAHEAETVTTGEVIQPLIDARAPFTDLTLKKLLLEIALAAEVPNDGGSPPKPASFEAEPFFKALAAFTPRHRGHPQKHGTIAAAIQVAAEGGRAHPREIARRLIAAGAPDESVKSLAISMGRHAQTAGLMPTREKAWVHNPERSRSRGRHVNLYRADYALGLLAKRLEQIMGDRGIALSTQERVLSTEEMIAEGLIAQNYGTNFAIRVADPIEGVEIDSPEVDPYVLGYWLGDGDSASGVIACDSKNGDQDNLIAHLIEAGYPARQAEWNEVLVTVPGVVTDLRAAGVLGDKHIPTKYLRASYDQRLAVLQGLMDSDGHVDLNGSCELSLSDRGLATDALELIRSLGIKASVSWDQPASYRGEDGELVECRDRHRIHFTTAQPVCRLPRKAARLPEQDEVRPTTQWLYVESIEPVEPEPMRCITVDSVDSTYLIEGFVPTHNTLLMQWEMFQTDLLNYPQIVVDPKAKSDLTPVVEAMPNGRVYSLDELAKYDGIFDAIKFAPNPDVAVEFALATITALNPYGSDRDMAAAEPDLIQALRYGMGKGHRSTLTALKRATQDGKLASHHVEQIEKLSTSSPMFSALVGHTDEGEGLGAYEGTTLIKVGDQELNLPDPGTPASGLIQRVNLALVRNIVFASAMALNKRKGVLRLDEAWVFTSSSPKELERLGRLARSQTIDVQLYTQRISDALDANLQNYLTRGLILHVRDHVEAAAACKVFNLEADEGRIGRIRAAGTLDNDSASPNWNSLKALKDPQSREVIRGSVGLYVDIHGRVVPVEIRVPPRFLKLASTNIDDVTAREDEADERDRIRQTGERVVVPA